jgi:outer membrane protein, heavy metal efflux system
MWRQKRFVALTFLLTILISSLAISADTIWITPLDTTSDQTDYSDDSLSIAEVINLVAENHPILKSLDLKYEQSLGMLKQAGLWPNPEFGIEIEDISWNKTGFRETELSFSLTQEIDLWGKRSSQKDVARQEINAAKWQNKVTTFDLYLLIKVRFYELAHAQRETALSASHLELTQAIEATIARRVEKGAALTSELLLAGLEKERSILNLEDANLNQSNASSTLASLWKRTSDKLVVIEPDFEALSSIDYSLILDMADSNRNIMPLSLEEEMVSAKIAESRALAKPSLTLSGGIKRSEADGANSFIFGLAVPLPFFNRNQGEIASLTAEARALDYEKKYARIEAEAEISSMLNRHKNLELRYQKLGSRIIPAAKEAYNSLRKAYDAGKIPYATLLEGERTMISFQSELNNTKHAIRMERINIERLTGLLIEKL